MSYSVTIDLFAEPPVNEAAKPYGIEFCLTVSERNVSLKPKSICSFTSFDWPIETVHAQTFPITAVFSVM